MNKLVLILLAVATLAVPAAFAKKKPRLIYDHTATMIYHAAKFRNLIEDRTDLYHVGEYTCTPGDEHYAPDCRTYMDWIVTEAISYTEIRLEDIGRIIVTSSICWCDQHICKSDEERKILDGHCREREQWDQSNVRAVVRDTAENLNNPFLQIARDWELGNINRPVGKWESLEDGAKKMLPYRVLTDKHGQLYIEMVTGCVTVATGSRHREGDCIPMVIHAYANF